MNRRTRIFSAIVEDQVAAFNFPTPDELSPPIIRLEDVSVGYDGRAILRDLKDEFGSGVYGVSATAALMSREGKLKSAVWNWKDAVAPAIAAGPGS